MSKIIPILFCLLAIIHVIPALSGLSTERISGLYGIPSDDKTLITLLQHRAVLFGLVAAACAYAAHTVNVRWPVLIGTIVSMGSFIAIALPRGQASGALGKIVIVDAIGLAIAALLIILLIKVK